MEIKLELGFKEKRRSAVRLQCQPDISGKPVTLNRVLSNTKLSWLFLQALHNATGSVVAGRETQTHDSS